MPYFYTYMKCKKCETTWEQDEFFGVGDVIKFTNTGKCLDCGSDCGITVEPEAAMEILLNANVA